MDSCLNWTLLVLLIAVYSSPQDHGGFARDHMGWVEGLLVGFLGGRSIGINLHGICCGFNVC